MQQHEKAAITDATRGAKCCPVCGGETIVVNTRENKYGEIERRRECVECGRRFSTVESFKRKSA